MHEAELQRGARAGGIFFQSAFLLRFLGFVFPIIECKATNNELVKLAHSTLDVWVLAGVGAAADDAVDFLSRRPSEQAVVLFSHIESFTSLLLPPRQYNMQSYSSIRRCVMPGYAANCVISSLSKRGASRCRRAATAGQFDRSCHFEQEKDN